VKSVESSRRSSRDQRDRALATAAVVLGSVFFGWQCGGGTEVGLPPQSASQKEGHPSGLTGDDQSRCDYKGRGDREATESSGPGSLAQNIRRVYALVGEGEERRRVLICREVDTNLDGVKDVVRTYNERGEALRETADSDFDGKVDTWVTFTRGKIAKVSVDHNKSGKPDEIRVYMNGKLSRVQRDTNADGKIDTWEIYDDGKLQRAGVDLDRDGRVDRWDRDEITLRELNEKERRDDEAAEKKAADEQKRQQEQALDGGVTDARVSARKRE
jgi:hypothetical protein